MQNVRAKKNLGQHFLKEESVARQITALLAPGGRYHEVLEIGPGMGILSASLFERSDFRTTLVEVDSEAVQYLREKFPGHHSQIIEADFLGMDLEKSFPDPFAVIGNFPYNISSQILFRILENRKQIPEAVGMFQKEVAERITSPPGNRDYGIPSVLLQAYFDVTIEMTLHENDFNPPPKVKSTVLRFERKENFNLGCDEKKFFAVVKMAFNQRRKMLRNALSSMLQEMENKNVPYLTLRAEALSWQQFVELTNALDL